MVPHKGIAPGDSAGHKYQTWYVTIDTKRVAVADLFRPQYWIACLHLKTNDLIRCVANDGSYDFTLKVKTYDVANSKNAVTVELWPKLTPEIVAEAEGEAASEMVPTVINGKPVPRVESFAMSGERIGWRLIGFDGDVVDDQLQSEDNANAAYDGYLTAHGITHELEQPVIDARTGETPAPKPPTQVAPGDRPGQFSHAKKKEIAKREAKLAKRREIDERNKARTAERLAAAAGDAA
jgi:hypothetical protein